MPEPPSLPGLPGEAREDFESGTFPFSSRSEWGLADYDVKHNFKLWGLWTPHFFDSHGWFGNASYLRKLDRWSFSGSVNYTRNNQTAFIGYTSSGYGYTAAMGRKFHIYSYWSANASGSKST